MSKVRGISSVAVGCGRRDGAEEPLSQSAPHQSHVSFFRFQTDKRGEREREGKQEGEWEVVTQMRWLCRCWTHYTSTHLDRNVVIFPYFPYRSGATLRPLAPRAASPWSLGRWTREEISRWSKTLRHSVESTNMRSCVETLSWVSTRRYSRATITSFPCCARHFPRNIVSTIQRDTVLRWIFYSCQLCN